MLKSPLRGAKAKGGTPQKRRANLFPRLSGRVQVTRINLSNSSITDEQGCKHDQTAKPGVKTYGLGVV